MKRKLLLATVVLSLSATPACFIAPAPEPMRFPNGKRFAFTIIDDTDMTTLERVKPIYEILDKYGVKTTKTVWVYDTNDPSYSTNLGDSLRNPAYRAFILDLHRKGFEIALHGVRGGSSRRGEVISGLEEFKNELGAYPSMHINHSQNRDNLYWGGHVFAFAPLRWAGVMANRHPFDGDDPRSEYFWGDLAKERIKYVRRYTFPEINLLRVNSSFPYHLDDKPFVNYWFPTSNGDRIREFTELLNRQNVETLEREGGVCLVYAHLGSGSFNRGNLPDPRFEERIRELVAHNGWFVPASQILDYMRGQPSWTGRLTLREKVRIEARYIAGQLLPGL
jgi:hypothetical protein